MTWSNSNSKYYEGYYRRDFNVNNMTPKNNSEDNSAPISIANLLKRNVTPEQTEIDESDIPEEVQDTIKTVEDALKDI